MDIKTDIAWPHIPGATHGQISWKMLHDRQIITYMLAAFRNINCKECNNEMIFWGTKFISEPIKITNKKKILTYYSEDAEIIQAIENKV